MNKDSVVFPSYLNLLGPNILTKAIKQFGFTKPKDMSKSLDLWKDSLKPKKTRLTENWYLYTNLVL